MVTDKSHARHPETTSGHLKCVRWRQSLALAVMNTPGKLSTFHPLCRCEIDNLFLRASVLVCHHIQLLSFLKIIKRGLTHEKATFLLLNTLDKDDFVPGISNYRLQARVTLWQGSSIYELSMAAFTLQ